VLADQVRGDAVQPGAGVSGGEVVPVPLAEGVEKRVRDDVVGRVRAQPAGGVAVQRRGVPVVKAGERLRVVPGTLDEGGVVVCVGVWVGRGIGRAPGLAWL